MGSTAGKNWTEEDEKLLLETIDTWVENEVKPIAREYDRKTNILMNWLRV